MQNQLETGEISAVVKGINWLLGLQNRDGGIPTFCRGWGVLPFDKSSTDITAHAIRAFQAWQDKLTDDALKRKMSRAIDRMFGFLERTQQKDGSWHPLWFGNQFMPDDANPCYGTAKVLLALAETKKESAMTHNGLHYLLDNQNPDGGWGRTQRIENIQRAGDCVPVLPESSVEETAVVVEALSFYADRAEVTSAYHRGLNWLVEAVESDHFLQSSPIGLYFAKLWYYEDLYPIMFTASALRRALKLNELE
ncbi:MAG: hypothetical protein LBI05_12175 [Planctomycetaceae bacterium]|jgi:squalene-hopene/tetraprenyl-beta-curcumene cyclase|nr:hypothetical protein [Planctomycetaceae bacterium]